MENLTASHDWIDPRWRNLCKTYVSRRQNK